MGRTNPSAANNTAAFSQLQAENDALKKENRDLRQKLERMNELLLNAQRARFGSSSEKQDYVMPNQVGIFNEAEAEQDPKAPEPTEETILVPAHTRKPKRTMDELAAGLPVKEILERENIFVMDEKRAMHQDIRPIHILILNLMPLKEETELQLLRSLSNTPLQVDVTFMAVESHQAKNTSANHLNKFYQTFPELKNNKYDGMIITGAPVEQMEFEEVDYWKELVKIMDWTNTHVTSTIYLCWAAQAGLYHHYGLKKRKLDKKMFGLFWHKVMNRKIPLVRGFDDMFLAPHSRHTEVPIEDIHNCKELTVLAESDEAGLFLAMADGGRKIFVMGHPEYDRVTLDGEYKRDVSKNLPIEIPENYYKDNNPENRPLLMWRAHANNLYTNWLNYYVYQSTPFDLYGTPDFEHI